MSIKFLEKEQLWQHEQTRYWFEVDGENYCLADTNGNLDLLDSEGYPIEHCNDHDRIKDKLTPYYKRHIAD